MKKVPSGHKLLHYIIKKFVKSKNIPWGYEVNQAKKLIKFESNPWFWIKVKEKELKSLDWLLSFEGKQFLLKEKAFLDTYRNKKIERKIQKDKIGLDKRIKKNKKNLIDFIKG